MIRISFRKHHYYHSNDNNFIRKIIRITNGTEEFDKCLLIYFYKNAKSSEQLKLTVHGNGQTSTNLQYRSSGNLMDNVKTTSQLHGSLTANFNNLVDKRIREASLSEIPKNRKQLANQRLIIKQENESHFKSKDELHDAIINNPDGEFIRSIDILHSSYRTVVFSQLQIFDLVSFCAFVTI